MTGVYGEDLLPQHARLLEESGIDPAVARKRGYRSVTTKAELERLGFGRSQRGVPALLVPVWDVWGEVATYQTRPDMPRVGRDGRTVKYETPAGTRMVVDVPPRARQWLGDPGLPLFVIEGARKADAAVSRACAVSPFSVSGTSAAAASTGARQRSPTGSRSPSTTAATSMPSDSDVMTKPGVWAALDRLKELLERRGATVSMVYLPSGEGGAKVGLDDFLAAGDGVAGLFALVSRELRHPPTDQEGVGCCPYQAGPEGRSGRSPPERGLLFPPCLRTSRP